MLATLKDIWKSAQAGGYAAPAFDCVEDLMARTILGPIRQRLAEKVAEKIRLLDTENRV